MDVQILAEHEITPETDAKIRDCLVTCFPHGAEVFSKSRIWNNCPPSWTIIIISGKTIIAGSAILERNLRVGAASFRTAGIGNVCVRPEYRKKRLAQRVTETAMDVGLLHGFDFGLLFTGSPLDHVYQKAGWKTLPDRKIISRDKDGKPVLLKAESIGMTFPLSRAIPESGDIDLQGPTW